MRVMTALFEADTDQLVKVKVTVSQVDIRVTHPDDWGNVDLILSHEQARELHRLLGELL